MSRKMQRMQYTDEQRAEALQLLAEVGKIEASRRTGIPHGTIASWGSRAGVKSPPNPFLTEEARAVHAATLAERKAKLADQLATLSVKAVAKLVERINADEISARDLVSALTSAIDRLQLLTGEATSRTVVTTVEEARDKAAAAVIELRTRQAA